MYFPDYPKQDEEEANRLGSANTIYTPPQADTHYHDHYSFPTHKLSKPKTTKIPLVIVACGSFNPVTYLHLRMFEMAVDYINDMGIYELLGAYFSPVSDGYNKPGLCGWKDRVEMCLQATKDSEYIMVDSWEASQATFVRTCKVLEHFDSILNPNSDSKDEKKKIRINLIAGGDLIQSFAIKNLWDEKDLDRILGDFGCIIIERMDSDVYDFMLQNDHLHRHRKSVFVVKQVIHNDISSTKLRLFVKRGLSIKYLTPESVINYIKENSLYVSK